MTYPTPGQLADYLEQPGRKKARRQFADTSGGPGRCCLGHYADMCGIEYIQPKAIFARMTSTRTSRALSGCLRNLCEH